MPDGAPRTTVESPWLRVLEASILFVPVVYALLLALGGLKTLLPVAGSETTIAEAFVGGTGLVVALGLLFYLLAPVALFFDARATDQADLAWEPSGPRYALVSLFVGPVASLDYLHRRYQHTADGTIHWWTWYLVAQLFVMAPGSVVLLVVGYPAAVTPLALSAGAFFVGVYRDAAHVRTRTDEWLPNPVNWYVLTLVSAVFLVGPLLLGAYYLLKRRATVGLGESGPPAETTARPRHH